MEVAGPWKFFAGELESSDSDFQARREMYAGEIAVTDRHIEAVVEALAQEGILDDTLVIVTSDHGENIGEHGMIDHALSMYDLERDAAETVDVAAAQTELEQSLRDRLRHWMSTIESGTETKPLESLDDESFERLRSLGDVE